jgi:triacylglycerol lipase
VSILRAILTTFTLLSSTSPARATPPAAPELVVLVHGMGRSPFSMRALERHLTEAGYEVLNWGYSSTCCSIAELGAELQDDLEAHTAAAPRRVHFVGHSLGNIIIRWALTHDHPPPTVGRVVMLAPPNQGAHSADRFAPLVGWALKPIRELGTDRSSTARSIPRVTGVPIAIIAGQYDGKVSVAETQLAEAVAHRVVPATHSFLAQRRDVQTLVVQFLRTGVME